jgi:hypothetical protein
MKTPMPAATHDPNIQKQTKKLHQQGDGDLVTATADHSAPPGHIIIDAITGDGGRLSLKPTHNCIGIAARETLALFPHTASCGLRLKLHKGLPLGSGMGSSAASAAAACVAVNALFGNPLTREELVLAGLQSEAYVSGFHADNIAPALLGGFVLVRCVPETVVAYHGGAMAGGMSIGRRLLRLFSGRASIKEQDFWTCCQKVVLGINALDEHLLPLFTSMRCIERINLLHDRQMRLTMPLQHH